MAKLDPTIAKETPQLFFLQGFDGLNQHDDRRAIGDQECSWLENLVPLGAGNARALYDASLLYTASKTIVYDFCFNIAAQFYHALFYSDGSAEAVTAGTGTATSMASAGTFSVTPTLPACAQWGASGIVIVTADTNGYWAWDGTLYSPGDFAPAWLSGLAALLTPTGTTNTSTSVTAVSSTSGVVIGMRITDTTHADITASTLITAFVANTSITLSNAAVGSHVGDTLNIGWMMPLGVKGTAVEIYTNRVWIMNGAQFTNSAPGNGADFSTADGGGTTKSTDGFLKVSFINAKQSNGFLYLFGDGSINVISNVQTTGSPATTTFNNQNVDPQTGLGWRDALVPFGRALCFANPTGVYALFGGAATKISDKLDRLFENANFTTLVPTMAVTSVFSVRMLIITLNTLDPTTGTQRNVMALWNGSKWFIASQQWQALYLATLEEDAHPHAHANDATRVFHLFETSSSTLAKKVQTKLWPGRSQLIEKISKDVYVETNDIAGTGVNLSGTLDSDTNPSVAFAISADINFVNNSNQPLTFVNNSSQPLQFVSSPAGIQAAPANQAGNRLGLTLTSTAPDFILIGAGETYDENSFLGR